MSNPMTQVYKKVIFRNKDWHSDNFGLRNPVIMHSENILAEMRPLSRRTRHPPPLRPGRLPYEIDTIVVLSAV